MIFHSLVILDMDILRSILHNPEMYPEPEEFRPGKLLRDGKLHLDVKDPNVAFRDGRR
jgi:cytochrome P450